jgi:peptidoglycan/LPS O-acetylase OafA/YrhL
MSKTGNLLGLELMRANASHRNVYLDWLRGISALIVCAGHTRNALMPDFADLPGHGLLASGIYFVTGYGHAAVIVFFVLSGYLVGGSVLTSSTAFSWRRYLVNRYVRLWVVLLPALVWTWLLDQQTMAIAPQVLQGQLSQDWHSLPKPGEYSASLHTFWLNLGFQQTVHGPVFGSNGPLWSLANEAWYYLLFPLLLLPVTDRRWQVALTHLPLAGLILAFMPLQMLLLFPIWVAGALVRRLPQGLLKGRHAWGLASALAFLAVLVAYKKLGASRFETHVWDWMIGLPFTFWVAYLVQNASAVQPGFFNRVAIRFSDFSYSLYLVHMPLAVLCGALISVPLKPLGTPQDFLVFLAVVAAQVLVAYGFWWLFERKTDDIKRLVLKALRA